MPGTRGAALPRASECRTGRSRGPGGGQGRPWSKRPAREGAGRRGRLAWVAAGQLWGSGREYPSRGAGYMVQDRVRLRVRIAGVLLVRHADAATDDQRSHSGQRQPHHYDEQRPCHGSPLRRLPVPRGSRRTEGAGLCRFLWCRVACPSHGTPISEELRRLCARMVVRRTKRNTAPHPNTRSPPVPGDDGTVIRPPPGPTPRSTVDATAERAGRRRDNDGDCSNAHARHRRGRLHRRQLRPLHAA